MFETFSIVFAACKSMVHSMLMRESEAQIQPNQNCHYTKVFYISELTTYTNSYKVISLHIVLLCTILLSRCVVSAYRLTYRGYMLCAYAI